MSYRTLDTNSVAFAPHRTGRVRWCRVSLTPCTLIGDPPVTNDSAML
jgi:hypothetical protein